MFTAKKALFCSCLLLGTISLSNQAFAYRGEAQRSTYNGRESSNDMYSGNREDEGAHPNEMYGNPMDNRYNNPEANRAAQYGAEAGAAYGLQQQLCSSSGLPTAGRIYCSLLATDSTNATATAEISH